MKNFQRIISVICLLLLPLAMSVSVKALQGTSKHNKQFKAPAQPVKSIQPQIPAAPQKVAKKNLPKKTAIEPSKGKPPIRKDIDYGPYMNNLQRCVQARWHPPENVSFAKTTVSFQVLKDGSFIQDSIKIISSDGIKENDAAALDAFHKASSDCIFPLPEGSKTKVRIDFSFTKNNPKFRKKN